MKKIIVVLLVLTLGCALSAQTIKGKVETTKDIYLSSNTGTAVIDTMSFQLPKVDLYAVITDSSFEKLVAKVNEYIKAGWQPIGGISAGPGGRVYQAMVMYK